MFRKFYEAVIAEGGGTGAEVVERFNPAEAMAKHGSKSDENSAEKLIDITEKKEVEKPVEKVETTAKVEEPITTEKPASETSQEKTQTVEEPKKVETAPIVQEPVKVQTLDEVLKNNQPDTILKALGFDDEKVALVQDLKEIDPKLVGIIQAWKGGTLGDYVKELATDYSKMPPEEVMRHQLRLEYPKATERQLDILYKKEIVDFYNLDSVDEDEAAEGRELLAAKSDKFRDAFIEKQNNYLLPKPPEPKQEVIADKSEDLKAKENVESYVRELKEDPFTKDIIANKKITLGEGETKFNFPVDTDLLISAMTDPNKIAELMTKEVIGEDGKKSYAIDTKKQILSTMIQVYGEQFLEAYGLHMKGLGGKEVIEPIDNARKEERTTTSKADPLPSSAAAAMAKGGTRRSGG